MKTKCTLCHLLTALCAVGISTGFANAATTIYSDDFSTGTTAALNGQALVTPTTTTWTATNWQKNTTTDSATNSSNSGSAMVPISFAAGDIITATARVVNNAASSSSGWVAFGFSSGSIATNGSGGRNWTLWRGNDQVRASLANAGLTGPTDVTPAGESNTLDLRMIYDVDAGSMTWLYKNPSASSWTEFHSTTSLSGGMTHVGFANNVGSVAVQSFEVVNIPEPSTALFGSLGILALLRRRR